MRLALGDAFDLRRVQGINLLAALARLLMAHRMGQRQQLGEGGLLAGVAPDLARDVAEHAAQIGPQCPQRPVGALELFGVGVTLMRDQRVFVDARVGLAQNDTMLPGQGHQFFARAVHELCVGRKRHRFGLHRRVDNDFGEVGRLGRAGARGDVQAFLNERDDLVLAHALTPSGH